MKKETGIHFYINVINFDDVVEAEETKTGNLQHSIHALDTLFTSVENYGNRHYRGLFQVEKITGARLHLYVRSDDMVKNFEIISSVAKYAHRLTIYMVENISKYKTLIPFVIYVGACYGNFYVFNFKRENADEMTTIGYAANYAAKLQALASTNNIAISANIYDMLEDRQKASFMKKESASIKKYAQEFYYEANINKLYVRFSFTRDLERASEIAGNVNLSQMNFRSVNQQLSYRNLSKTECRKLTGIPLFADIRGFTQKFDSEDVNLEEMASKTQRILTAMYDTIENQKGTHVQFQGDREIALFHDYSAYDCTNDAVIAGLKIIDKVQEYEVCVGVGQASGRLFAAKIGARGERDNILLGRTVLEADSNEDEKAKENQLVISKKIYEHLLENNVDLASIFSRLDEESYYTAKGYQGFLAAARYRQLQDSNKKKNYNGAWGKEVFD